ncbi:hypothetical protein FRB91_009400 [Serendipita sp. 411]|nr:hypothetical protein FRC19_010092 [Serendipita sp. 401]KAG8823039.1 hypothetical protein FRC18_010834 [Serendipita sp. 400]KAG8850048.1 hypothetical protein FRB91_009400 [Serendipita sp. 411]
MDFAQYLNSLDERVKWETQQLQGGLVNVTMRATPLSHEAVSSSTPPKVNLNGYKSMVMKHAPPYIASIGEEAPFSQFRQGCLQPL